MYRGSNYDLFLQSLSGFLIIALIFIPILKWGFTTRTDKKTKMDRRNLRRDLMRLRRK